MAKDHKGVFEQKDRNSDGGKPSERHSHRTKGGKRKHKKKARVSRIGSADDSESNRNSSDSNDVNEGSDPIEGSARKGGKNSKREDVKNYKPPRKETMEFVQKIQALGFEGLIKMFDQELSVIGNTNVDTSQFVSFYANMSKNQSKDIPCLEKTRVILKPVDGSSTSDYIHANWVRIPFVAQKFIATQTPLKDTVDDFWRMVMQENVDLIVNLTGSEIEEKTDESQDSQGDKYWPIKESGIKHCSSYIIGNKSTTTNGREEYSVSDLEVLPKGVGEARIVRIVYFSKKSIQRTPSMIRLLKMISKHSQVPDSPPVLVHCATGVNMTGTLILTEIIMCWLKNNPPRIVDFKEIFQIIRSQRAKAVEKDEDFTYAVCVILSYFCAKHYRSKELRERIASVLKDLPK